MVFLGQKGFGHSYSCPSDIQNRLLQYALQYVGCLWRWFGNYKQYRIQQCECCLEHNWKIICAETAVLASSWFPGSIKSVGFEFSSPWALKNCLLQFNPSWSWRSVGGRVFFFFNSTSLWGLLSGYIRKEFFCCGATVYLPRKNCRATSSINPYMSTQ